MVHTYNLGTQEVKVEGLRVQNEPSYSSEFETCLGYIRPYLKKERKRRRQRRKEPLWIRDSNGH